MKKLIFNFKLFEVPDRIVHFNSAEHSYGHQRTFLYVCLEMWSWSAKEQIL